MFKSFRILLLLLVFCTVNCSKDNQEPDADIPESTQNVPPIEPPGETQSFEDKLQTIIDSRVGPDKLLGVSVSIRVNGEERWHFVSGNSDDSTPISREMRFGIASITKTMVAATMMALIEDGLLALDDPIRDHITLNHPYVDDSITIFQLLNHLAGIKGYFQHPDIWPRVESDLLTPLAPIEIADYIGEPLFDPGTQYQYSNSHFLILGLVIEAVSGKTVGEVMREKFWGPLGLNQIYFGANESIEGPIAIPWRDNDGDGSLENIADQFGPAYHSIFYTAADVFATASDLSHWAHLLFTGQALSASSTDQMVTFLDLDDPIANGYGLGVRRVLLAGRNMWGHTGGMRGYGSYMFYDPVSKVSIVLLNNQSRSENGPLYRYQLVEAVLSEIFEEL